MDDICSIKICYLDDSVEFITGIIDYECRVIRIIEFDNQTENGIKIKGFVNFNAIKKVDILKKMSVCE